MIAKGIFFLQKAALAPFTVFWFASELEIHLELCQLFSHFTTTCFHFSFISNAVQIFLQLIKLPYLPTIATLHSYLFIFSSSFTRCCLNIFQFCLTFLKTIILLNLPNVMYLLKIIYLLICLVNVVHLLKYPPSLYLQPHQLTVINSSRPLEMPCLATGHPKPMYRWKKDGLDFNFRNDSRISDSLEMGTFEIANPLPTDAGLYQCIAENQFGKAFSKLIYVKEMNRRNGTLLITALEKQGMQFSYKKNNYFNFKLLI